MKLFRKNFYDPNKILVEKKKLALGLNSKDIGHNFRSLKGDGVELQVAFFIHTQILVKLDSKEKQKPVWRSKIISNNFWNL